jgi:hypothetical protein
MVLSRVLEFTGEGLMLGYPANNFRDDQVSRGKGTGIAQGCAMAYGSLTGCGFSAK